MMISRWSSPMPSMIVWPVSSSVWTLKVGSSSERRCSAMPSLSWSTLVLGSMATEMTGSGKVIDSRRIWCASSVSVSPVVVDLRPTAGDVARENLVHILAADGVHAQDAPDALALAGGGVHHG